MHIDIINGMQCIGSGPDVPVGSTGYWLLF